MQYSPGRSRHLAIPLNFVPLLPSGVPLCSYKGHLVAKGSRIMKREMSQDDFTMWSYNNLTAPAKHSTKISKARTGRSFLTGLPTPAAGRLLAAVDLSDDARAQFDPSSTVGAGRTWRKPLILLELRGHFCENVVPRL